MKTKELKYPNRSHPREKSGSWKGGRQKAAHGAMQLLMPEHPNANGRGLVYEHVFVASTVLGRGMPKGVVVHHVDEDRSNNARSNLVICENQGYHRLLHRRLRAYHACGHANWIVCGICAKYDDPANMWIKESKLGVRALHRVCNAKYVREHYARKKAELGI